MALETDPTTSRAPIGPASKREVVRELGELALVLPSLVNQALEANDRAKYYLTLLQASAAHARLPDRPAPSLHGERLAAGINDQWLDQVVESSVASDDDDAFVVPRVGDVHDALIERRRRDAEAVGGRRGRGVARPRSARTAPRASTGFRRRPGALRLRRARDVGRPVDRRFAASAR